MKYINKSKVRKLVSINREKKWINPGEIVDLNSVDIRLLGANASVIVELTKRMILRKEKYAKRAAVRKARKIARLKHRAEAEKIAKNKPASAEPKKKTAKKVKKSSQESKKPINTEVDRAKLKKILTNHTKANILEIGNRIGAKLTMQQKKDVMIDAILSASKEKGYAKVLKRL